MSSDGRSRHPPGGDASHRSPAGRGGRSGRIGRGPPPPLRPPPSEPPTRGATPGSVPRARNPARADAAGAGGRLADGGREEGGALAPPVPEAVPERIDAHPSPEERARVERLAGAPERKSGVPAERRFAASSERGRANAKTGGRGSALKKAPSKDAGGSAASGDGSRRPYSSVVGTKPGKAVPEKLPPTSPGLGYEAGDAETGGPGALKSAASSTKGKDGGGLPFSFAGAMKPGEAVPEKLPPTSPRLRDEAVVPRDGHGDLIMRPKAGAVPETVPAVGPTMEYRESRPFSSSPFMMGGTGSAAAEGPSCGTRPPASASAGVTPSPIFSAELGAGNERATGVGGEQVDGQRPSDSAAPGASAIPGIIAEEEEFDNLAEPQQQSNADSSVAFSAYVVPDSSDARQRRAVEHSNVQQPAFDETEQVYEGVSIPPPSQDGPHGDSWRQMPKKHRCVLGVFVICIAMAAVAVPIIVIKSRSGSAKGEGTLAPIVTVTGQPSSERFFAIKSEVESLMSSTSLTLEDVASPQHRALVWLADEDGRQVDWHEKKSLTQRFVLATLSFATGGEESWIENCNFLSSDHECKWNFGGIGVKCLDDNITVNDITIPENNLTGVLPEELSLISSLMRLELPANDLFGPIPTTLGNLRRLSSLLLDENRLSGAIPSSLGGLAELRVLELQVNKLTGTIPTLLGRLSSLTNLLLGFNHLTGAIPTELNSLGRLELLFLSSNSLGGNLPFTAEGVPNLRAVSIGENNIAGSIPVEMFASRNLTNINFNGNMLTGAIPAEVGDLVHLELLHVHDNFLSGTLPPSLVGLSRLGWLSVALNELSGTVLTEVIGDSTELRYLYLSANRFGGTLSDSIGDLSELEELYLHGNQFSGLVPRSLAGLKSLNTLTLHNNSFSGDLEFLCDIPPGFLSADCHGNDTELQCACCTSCCSDELGLVGPDFIGCFQP